MRKRTLAPKLVAGALIFSLSISGLSAFPYLPSDETITVYAAESDFDFIGGRITAYHGSDQNLNIPATINGMSVTEIGYEAFSGCTSITTVTIPDSVNAIGSMAFDGCTNLQSIAIPSGVQTIAPYTFYGCSKLTNVTLPDSIQTIMLEAFGGCTSLAAITLPDGVSTLEDEAFAANSALKEITMPESLKTFNENIFDGRNSELTIVAPKNSAAESYAAANQIQFREKKTSTETPSDSEAANNVVTLISQIGEVTLESEPAITSARAAYEKLTSAQKDLVTNYETLYTAEQKLAELKQGNMTDEEIAAANKEAADKVISQITQIGSVTLDSADAIKAARDSYTALTPAQKQLVTNYDVLESAEQRYNDLKDAYEQASKAEKDRIAAEAVIDAISAIGEVTLESETAIKNARDAYDDLTADQKALVTNFATLTSAEDTLQQLKDEATLTEADKADRAAGLAVMIKIQQLGTITLDSEADIVDARTAYDQLSEKQKTYVKNYEVLQNAEKKLADLKDALNNDDEYDKDQLLASLVSDLISQIGTVTLEKGSLITRARNAYDGLNPTQKSLVSNYTTLTAAENAYAQLSGNTPSDKDIENQNAANSVMTLIANIGYVTLNSSNGITKARTAYDALTSEQKSLVTNYDVLTNAEKEYKTLKDEFDLAQKKEADQNAANAVIERISQLGNITLNSEATINSIKAAYNALTDDQKKLVTNYVILTNAEAALTNLKNAQQNVKLSLSATAATIYTKGQKTVTLTASDNGTALLGTSVTWDSKNPKIATVVNGKVTAKKKGTVTISATYKGTTVNCTVKVKKPTLKLKKTKAKLKVGKKVKIRATATPTGKITYKSRNKKVATVNKKGTVTAKGAGTAKITVSVNGVKKTFKVTVTE